jgi:hypothetical protein
MARVIATLGQVYGPSAAGASPTTAVTPVNTATSQAGDVNGGTSTSLPSASGIGTITKVLPSLDGTVFGLPMTWLAVLVAFIIGWKLVEEKRGGEEAFAKVRVDGTNAIKMAFMVGIVFIVAKYFARAYTVPGLSSLVLSA